MPEPPPTTHIEGGSHQGAHSVYDPPTGRGVGAGTPSPHRPRLPTTKDGPALQLSPHRTVVTGSAASPQRDFTLSCSLDSVKSIVVRPLEPKYLDLLTSGVHWHLSRSEAVRSFLLHAINRGWTWGEFAHHLLEPETYRLLSFYYHRGSRYSHRSVGDPIRKARTDWDRAVEYVRTHPATVTPRDVLHEIGEIRGQFREDGLAPSRTRVTDSLVLEYLHTEATRQRRITLSAPVRNIALATGISTATVARCLQRLVQQHWLRPQHRDGDVGHAAVYRLSTPAREKSCTDETGGRSPSTGRADCVSSVHGALLSTGQDLFLKLGRYCALVWEALVQTPQDIQGVQEIAGVGRRTAYKHLRRLMEIGLVKRVGDTYVQTGLSLDKAAAEEGAVGLREERRSLFARQRERWREVKERAQFLFDRKRYGKREAIRRALARQGEAPPSWVDVVTGEILADQDGAGRELTDEEIEKALSPTVVLTA